MSLEVILQELGFSPADALKLAEHDYFHHQKKTKEELENLFQGIAAHYECNEDAVKKAVLKFPQFAGYDHQRVVEQAAAIYGNEDAVKKAVLKHPPFAGYDHQRVLRQKGHLGRMAGLEREEIIEKILKSPVLASYSAQRYCAAFDVARHLEEEGFAQNEVMLHAFFSNYGKSPYVPNTNRKRISQVENGEEPPLLKKMRKYLTNYINKN